MNDHAKILLALGVVGALCSSIFFYQFSIIQFNEIKASEVGTVLLGLVFVALVIERATEVYVNVQGDPEIDNAALRDKSVAEAEVRRARTAFSVERAQTVPDAALLATREDEFTAALADHQKMVAAAAPVEEEIKQQTRKETSVVAIVLGILAALVGVRVLGPFLADGQFTQCLAELVDDAVQKEMLAAVKDNMTGDSLTQAKTFLDTAFAKIGCTGQPAWFTGVDVFLTGTLLAGGADGIHQIIKRFLTYSKQPQA